MFPFKFANIDEQYERYTDLKREDVARLEEWQRKQPHLPAPVHPIETALFLHRCRYNNELAKQRIDRFFTCRTHCPDLFTDRDPLRSDIQLAMDTWILTPLPTLTPEGYLVFYIRIIDPNPNVFNNAVTTKIWTMMIELALKQNGCCNGHVVVVDLQGFALAHLLKISLVNAKKHLLFLQTALPLRLKTFHFVNGVSFMDKVLTFIKPFIKRKEALHVHFGDNTKIFEFVPQDILPVECGGSKWCATDYYKNVTRKNIESHAEYFKLEERRLVDESKRPGSPITPGDLFGVEGTFKKLVID